MLHNSWWVGGLAKDEADSLQTAQIQPVGSCGSFHGLGSKMGRTESSWLKPWAAHGISVGSPSQHQNLIDYAVAYGASFADHCQLPWCPANLHAVCCCLSPNDTVLVTGCTDAWNTNSSMMGKPPTIRQPWHGNPLETHDDASNLSCLAIDWPLHCVMGHHWLLANNPPNSSNH